MTAESMAMMLLAIVLISTLSVLAEMHGGKDDVR